MKKNLTIICNLACLICFFIVLLGCDQPANKPATPKIVRKKIRVRKRIKRPLRRRRKPSKGPGPCRNPNRQPNRLPLPTACAAQKSEPPVVETGETAKPKPPVKPKSDISVTRTPSPPMAASQTAPDQPATPSDFTDGNCQIVSTGATDL